jgi:predicted SAM-dependent methyltransferase
MGFEKGIQEWTKFLKPGGYLAVSEITWTTDSRPKEIEDHWNNEHSEMDIASEKIRVLEKNGFFSVGYFTLPEYCWVENYYQPMQKRFSDFLENHPHSKMAERIVNRHIAEIEIYNTYKDYYTYGFYIAQKVS